MESTTGMRRLTKLQSRKRLLELDSDNKPQAQDLPASTSGTLSSNCKTLRIEAEISTHDDDCSRNERLKNLMSKIMSTDLVMENIAEELPAGPLLTLRRISTSWNSSFIPRIRKQHSQVWLNDYLFHLGKGSTTYFNSLPIPYTKYGFSISNIDPKHPRRDWGSPEPFFRFILKIYGSKVTSLELNWQQDRGVPISKLRKLIFNYTPALVELRLIGGNGIRLLNNESLENDQVLPQPLPKLRSLCVGLTLSSTPKNNESTVNRASYAQFLLDVIRSAEGLQELKLCDGIYGDHADEVVGPILKGLMEIKHIRKLKALKFPFTLLNYEMPVLLQLLQLARPRREEPEEDGNCGGPLALESFSARISPTRYPTDNREQTKVCKRFYEFLATQSPTLKNLKIDFDFLEDEAQTGHYLCRLPRMEHLKKLQFKHPKLDVDAIQFRMNATFVDTFPQLTKFTFKWDPPQGSSFPDVILKDFRRRDFFRLYHPGVVWLKVVTNVNDHSAFTFFGSVFPSLTRLDLCITTDYNNDRKENVMVDVKEFSKIWTIWPGLIAIQIKFEEELLDLDLDAFMSGVSKARLKHLRRNVDLPTLPSQSSLDSLREMVQKYKNRPAMSDLTHLREFTITFNAHGGDDHPRLTDMGVYFGAALASPTLQRLVLQGHGRNLVSEQCRTFITNSFGPLVEISL